MKKYNFLHEDHDGHNEGVDTDNCIPKRLEALWSFIPTAFSLEASLTDISCSD